MPLVQRLQGTVVLAEPGFESHAAHQIILAFHG
jgi:hypothetical protein